MNLNEVKCNLLEILLESIRTYFSDEFKKYTLISRSLLDLWHMETNILSKHVLCFFIQKFETFKEVLPSLVFHLRYCSYCAKLNFCTINFDLDLFLPVSNMYYLLLKHSCWRKKRTHYRITVRLSLNIIHRYYQ